MNEDDKTKLIGRIYPAIQSCVSNRYKIIVGYFAVAGVLVTDKNGLLNIFIETGALAFLSMIFTLFVAHNFVNYYLNAQEQYKIEQRQEECFPVVEAVSSAVMLLLIWSAFCLLKNI